MAKILRFRPVKERDGMKVGGAEGIVFVIIVLGAIFGVRYYFTVYTKSPSFALGSFLVAMKAGNPEAQYNMLDAEDQNAIGSIKNYEKSIPLARGYAARIENFVISDEKPSPKDPDELTLSVALTVRGVSEGSQLYQSSSQSVKDAYVLHKDAKGEWKIVLSKSQKSILQVKPTPPGDPINGG